jgi:CBS domain-containing protein/anti-sigma regulatory factor (Ser/Thr protein kinase)
MSNTATKIEELFYELHVQEVMSRNVITVSPQSTMRELGILLREHRISGAPVLERGKLVGIVSIQDLIQALEAGQVDCPVSEWMTRQVETLYPHQHVSEAITELGQTGYGRLPVVNRTTGKLVGILTQGDIIKGSLKRLDSDYRRRESEIHTMTSFFDDVVSEDTSIVLRYAIVARDFEHGGEASTRFKRSLQNLGFSPQLLRRVAIATYEAEMNLILHTSEGGSIRADVRRHTIQVDVTDPGPGIPDVDLAMQPGFSTAPAWIREMGFGAGMGLKNIRDCADEMSLTSDPDAGTHLRIQFRA